MPDPEAWTVKAGANYSYMHLPHEKDGSTPSLHPKFWCYISGSKSGSCGHTFWVPMIDTILLVSFSGSNPDIWFKH